MKYFEVFALLVIFIETAKCGKSHKRVVIHIPMKVKHLHHTHTVYKPVHHTLPVVEPSEDWDSPAEEYHFGNGRMIESLLSDWKQPQHTYQHSVEDERDHEYQNFEKYLKKISKTKQKLLNNKHAGWNQKHNSYKVAQEYLSNLKSHPQPEFDDYDDRYAPYDDEED
ncbi:unnamed protein product [Chironomus riparius]|uniref:Uncharacterized protein n=1 Tax=Chironomus riparius TaxID=315576 RepID=A0A9N9RIR9_9DIPT|nr:unnamed protein product [Chironomus riparius]